MWNRSYSDMEYNYVPRRSPVYTNRYIVYTPPSQLGDSDYYTGRTYNPAIPHVAHQRLTRVAPPPHGLVTSPYYSQFDVPDIRPSFVQTNPRLVDELDTYTSPIIDALELETKNIRTHADLLLHRLKPDDRLATRREILTARPERTKQFLSYPNVRLPVLYDHHVDTLPLRRAQQEVSSYQDYIPDYKRGYIGKGNLACMSFAAGQPISKRRQRYVPEENVSDNVQYLSYYDKMLRRADLAVEDARQARHSERTHSYPRSAGQKSDWLGREDASRDTAYKEDPVAPISWDKKVKFGTDLEKLKYPREAPKHYDGTTPKKRQSVDEEKSTKSEEAVVESKKESAV